MQPTSLRFGKSNRLKSLKEIGLLFESGESILAYPLRVVFRCGETQEFRGIKAAFSVSKRNFKKAVVRNRIRRQLKEAYRLNIHSQQSDWQAHTIQCMIIYIAREQLPYSNISRAMEIAFKKLNGKIRPASSAE